MVATEVYVDVWSEYRRVMFLQIYTLLKIYADLSLVHTLKE